MTKNLEDFLGLYNGKTSTKSTYRSALYLFAEHIYGVKRSGLRATKGETEKYSALLGQYFSEGREYYDDLLKFAASLQNEPPKSAKVYISAVKEYLAYNGIEFTQRQLKSIRLKLPKGGARTEIMDLDSVTVRKILEHTDLRGRALILTLASSGMRIGEALQITLDDIDLEAKPATINIRGEYTKTGDQRITFINREAIEILREWLKVREQYIRESLNKNKGLVSSGYGAPKNPDDDRVFPFSNGVAEQLWTNTLDNAGLLSIDKGTNRKKLRIHGLRTFFRSQLALGCPVDIVEALMGHEGYLTNAYRRYNKQQMADCYTKFEHLLYISMPKDIQKIESEFKDELNKNRKLIEDLILENRELRKEVEAVKGLINENVIKAMIEARVKEILGTNFHF